VASLRCAKLLKIMWDSDICWADYRECAATPFAPVVGRIWVTADEYTIFTVTITVENDIRRRVDSALN